MIDPKLQAELDQARTGLIELLPPLWWGLYRQCVEEGFSEEQAMRLVEVYVEASTGKSQ